jgi:light-regulated signal transduction histidine kinase (bacteriophytochrome)
LSVHTSQAADGTTMKPQPMVQCALEDEIRRLELRISELELEKTELEGFAALAAHELLEPLIKTEAYATLVSERLDECRHADSRRDLDVLGRGAARMRALVETILHDACAGEPSSRRRVLELSPLVHGCLAALEPEIRLQRARIDVAPLPTVTGDELVIRAVFTNLFVAALRSCPGSRCTMAIRAARRGWRWSLSIRSEGPAIAADEGVPPPRDARLGLTICRHLVERHGGRLGMEAPDDFSFTLPL